MPGRTSRYSKLDNQILEYEVLDVLAESKEPMTISEICDSRLCLKGKTPQKMARILSSLVDMGFVRKTQSKSRKRMIYMAVSQLEAQGITLSDD